MANIIILFASLTGNTELIAENLAGDLTDKKHIVDIKTFDYDPLSIEEVSEYDAILVGTYTWDDGSLPYELEDFYDELEEIDLTDKVFGVFGSADSFYEIYGGAIDLIGDRATDLGAKVLPLRLKIDISPNKQDIIHSQEFVSMAITSLG